MRVSWDAEIGRTEGQMLLTSVAVQRFCRESGRGLPHLMCIGAYSMGNIKERARHHEAGMRTYAS